MPCPIDVPSLLEFIECAGRRRDLVELASLAGVLCCLRRRCLVLAGRLYLNADEPRQREAPAAYNLKVAEAARLTGMSERWLYEHAHELPYARRHGSRSWRFSREGIERYTGKR